MVQRSAGKRCKKFFHAGQDDETAVIFSVVVFETALLDDGIEIGAERAQRVDGAAAMRGLQGEGALHVVMLGPAQPAALIGAGGTDEHAIHVEENAAGCDRDLRHVAD